VKGSLALGTELFNETLMTPRSTRSPPNMVCWREAVSHPYDHSSVTYRLRRECALARRQAGDAGRRHLLARCLQGQQSAARRLYRHVVRRRRPASVRSPLLLTVPATANCRRSSASCRLLAKHWWEGTDKSGNKRDVSRPRWSRRSAPAPIGQGFSRPATASSTKRSPTIGARTSTSPSARAISSSCATEYFRDSTVALEAFKGDQVDWRTENSAKNWATAYDFPAVRDKRVVLEEFQIRNFGVMQAFTLNTRRDKFKDARVRRAFNFAFDFEEMNKQIFFGQYKRISSYFEGTELASSGFPKQGAGNSRNLRDKVPADLFSKPYSNPVGGNPQRWRDNFREALALFREAGYENPQHQTGQCQDWRAVRRRVPGGGSGHRTLRAVLQALARTHRHDGEHPRGGFREYENRLRQWDYDIIVASWGQSLSPGNEQRGFWSSAAADQPGSRNLVGIKNPAVDALIDRLIFAKDRAELWPPPKRSTACCCGISTWCAMDLRQGARGALGPLRPPGNLPKYGLAGFPTIWWWDTDKAAKVPQRS